MVLLLKANTSCDQRSNYAEPSILAGVGDEDEEVSNKYSKGRGRQTISDKRHLNLAGNSPAAGKKKSTMNVRTALLYRKNLATLIDESVCSLNELFGLPIIQKALLAHHVPFFKSTYLFNCCCATIPLSTTIVMFCLWILGALQMSPMCCTLLRFEM